MTRQPLSNLQCAAWTPYATIPHVLPVLAQGNYVQIVIERMQREERLQRDAEKQQQQQWPGAGVPPPSPDGAPGFRGR